MPRATRKPPPIEEPPRGVDVTEPRVYHYDPHLGSPRDEYSRADHTHPDARRPELPGRFVAVVEGQTVINTMWGRRIVKWRAEPGTRCIILGYWSDGTVHLKWPAIGGVYRVDGRFPAWVVAEDKSVTLAGGGHMLSANNPPVRRRGYALRALGIAIMLLLLVVLVVLPQTREAIGSLAADLQRTLH